MPKKLTQAELVNLAQIALRAKPTFKLIGVRKQPTRNAKNFKVQCLDCGNVEARSTTWLRSQYGCMCTRGAKISSTSVMTKQEFSAKWNLEKRRLKVVSKFKGMHTRVKVSCLRCDHVWPTSPTNLRKAGCPKCAPGLLREKNLSLYGVEHALQRPEVRVKIKEAMIEKYGMPHALQNKNLFEKMVSSSYSTKPFLLGNRTVYVQGYEDFALSWLLANTKIKPSEICCGRDRQVPKIKYQVASGVTKVYYPDIFVPKHNLIVEVKSEYSYRARLSTNLRKAAACMAQGYQFRFLVMAKDGSRVHV